MELIVDEVVARLKAQCPSLRSVADAADMEPIKSARSELPGVFVFLASGAAPDDAKTTAGRQRVVARYGLNVVVKDQADLKQVFTEIKAAMLGWVPDVLGSDAVWDSFEFHSVDLQAIENGQFWYVQQWRIPFVVSPG
ncbi:hypothetical protein ABMA58_00175 [Oceanospirillum sp. HFRX-1_2]